MAFGACGLAIAAPKAAPKAASKPVTETVLDDQYFLAGDCDQYLSNFSGSEREALSEASEILVRDESIRYVSGFNSIVGDLKVGFEKRQIRFNTELDKGRASLKDSGTRYAPGFEDDVYSQAKHKKALDTWGSVANASGRTKAESQRTYAFVYCRVAVMASGLGTLGRYHETYIAYAKSKVRKATIGYFDVSADKGEYGPTVDTGNRFAEPKKWGGSRFFIVHASFKNMDTESRQPVEGSLFITYNGKEYEYDSVEPITLEGYNIWFRKINPLVTMKTKIVYRIPNEIEGPVYWRPGRNPTDTKLWLGYIDAEKP
jgi:hypothetical protein